MNNGMYVRTYVHLLPQLTKIIEGWEGSLDMYYRYISGETDWSFDPDPPSSFHEKVVLKGMEIEDMRALAKMVAFTLSDAKVTLRLNIEPKTHTDFILDVEISGLEVDSGC